ncbi:Fe2+-enterobactin ABC transporter substrate-binding protein [Chachezhania sediminis]|uniref:Fe2+-enterobactin ABC transporter substrate-binding protein n=1 Tax=Chachezhania sediminis TaxID=2599291 RepID=UPI00131D0CD5|nr:Fe2+-enterobactin ABC transporter substrate-binding protein [Chachezhania sediminis]
MPISRSDLCAAIGTAALCLALALPAQADEGWPRIIRHDGGELTLDAPPETVISASPGLTGTVLALEVPLQSTAAAMVSPIADDDGFLLQWADVAHERGVQVLYPRLAFDFEAVLAADPDLVIGSSTGADTILPYLDDLQAMGVPVLVLDYGRNDWIELARTLGRATGHEAHAERITQDFADRAAEAAAKMTRPDGTVSIVNYGIGGTYAVSKPDSAQARVLTDLGFTVTGLPDDMRGAVLDSREFDFISYENLPAAITGETVFILNGTPETVRAFLADPVLANLPAVQTGQVYPLGQTSFRIDYYSGLDIVGTVASYFTE